ncbi:protein phosphatase 2C domain-containing protein [Dactylosporangium sp. NPDC049525]|uniref:PP2C family protein-serine/threonine phosphatase n=1 Tax=Dactylosporangium sp. NPDC049525 TaxID=3154730 RepID=UPI00342F4B54
MVLTRVGAASDTGRVRSRNEDSAFAGAGVYAVADGMGGHAAGDVASGLAVAALRRLVERPDRGPQDVRAEIARANRDILASAVADPARTGMGTTVAGVSLVRVAGTEHWAVFNVGDSRVYRFVDDALTQITVDHSELNDAVRQHVVTRALGTDPGPDADLWVFPPTPGERFLICSDGLPRELADTEIAAVLRAETGAQDAADSLVRRAVSAGGRDNVTAVVVDHVAPADPDEDVHTTPPRRRA